MKKKFVLITFIMFIFPMGVLAKENVVSISCSDTELKKNSEMECEINASDMNFTVTSIAGEVVVSNNLKITNSSYDNENWTILDNEFDAENINLISENKNFKKDILITKFKIKAINEETEIGKIEFKNVLFGDDSYEEHEMQIENLMIDLTYDNQNDEVPENPNTGSSYIYVIASILVLMLGIVIYIKRKYIKQL